MNKLILKELTDDYVEYFYRPEDRGSCGVIRMNFGDEDATIVSRPTDDNSSMWHAKHALSAVEKLVKERRFPPTDLQIWW